MKEPKLQMRSRRSLYWLALILSVLAALYCLSGVVMNGHFAMLAAGEAGAGHRLAARVFAGLSLASVILAAASAVALWRSRRARRAV